MASTFVRVTNPEDIFDLWVAGLLYEQCDDKSLHFCGYEIHRGSVEEDHAYFLSYWLRGEGIVDTDVYGFLQED